MTIQFLIDVMKANPEKTALICESEYVSYSDMNSKISYWVEFLQLEKIYPGSVIMIVVENYSPESIALLLALADYQCIIVPITSERLKKCPETIDISQIQYQFFIKEKCEISVNKIYNPSTNKYYDNLRDLGRPGIVLFSSGTKGEAKAAVHDFSLLVEKYKKRRHCFSTLAFLSFDHIGGLDTLFYSLSNASCLIVPEARTPEKVCQVIEAYKVEVLPVSPTFLNLLLWSKAYQKYDLSSLKYITYGTEIMPEVVLKKCKEIFPEVNFLQKYGTTETGTLRSKSESSDSLWVKVGGEGFDIRIVDNLLEIKAVSSMLGYLNAASPFTSDGWYQTGDIVEQKGEYIKFLGRNSELINVGGKKVYPAEVEKIIYEVPGVLEVIVYSESNFIMGNIVCAKIRGIDEIDISELKKEILSHCKQKLEAYKIPIKIQFSDVSLLGDRYKLSRKQ